MYLHARPRPEPATEHPGPAFGPFGCALFALVGTVTGGLFGLIAGAAVVGAVIRVGGWTPDSETLETYLFHVGILASCLCAGLGCRYGLHLANLPRDRAATSLPPSLSLRHTEPVPHAGGEPMSATVTPQVVLVEWSEAANQSAGTPLWRAWAAMLSAHLTRQPRDGASAFVVGADATTHARFPLVVFDVLPPHWRFAEVQDRIAFYEGHGAEEYYILYPEFPMHVEALRRNGNKLTPAEVNGYVSPRTGLRFALAAGELTVFGRDGKPLRELGVDPAAV